MSDQHETEFSQYSAVVVLGKDKKSETWNNNTTHICRTRL